MSIFQNEILSASDTCSNCFARQRRQFAKPLKRATHADTDDEGYPVQDDDGHWVRRYAERVSWQTTVDDVPGPVVHEAGTLFCDCGVPGPYTRTWDARDVDADRRTALILAAVETLRAKGYRVGRRFVEIAVAELPDAEALGPCRSGVINDAFATAAAEAAYPEPESSPVTASP